VREFWERSAAASARSVAQRLREHALRTSLAHREYRLQTIRTTALAVNSPRDFPQINLEKPLGPDVSPGADALDPARSPGALEAVAAQAALPWDARGIVHVRHGAPDTVIQTLSGVLIYMPMTETWVYARATPPWLVHFGKWQGPDWFLLGPWVGCGDAAPPAMSNPEPPVRANRSRILDPGVAAVRAKQAAASGANPGAQHARDYYLALARVDRRYDLLATHCAGLVTNPGRRVEAIASQVRALAADYGDVVSGLIRSESARRRLTRPLRLHAAAYSFRDASGEAELASFAWVPAADVSQLEADASLQLSFALLGTSGAPLRVDTTALVRDGFERAGSVLRVAVRWPSPPPAEGARLHVFVGDARDPERGGYAEQRVITIPTGSLAMSSIVVAVPGEAGPLVRGDHRVAPQPGHVVTVGDEFRLFYELYGIERDAALETAVRIRRTREDDLEGVLAQFSGKRAERELQFREPAEPDRRGVVVRDVAIGGDLVPGDYAVDVVVRTPAGQLRGSTALRIREP
jgi:hypothetical protein